MPVCRPRNASRMAKQMMIHPSFVKKTFFRFPHFPTIGNDLGSFFGAGSCAEQLAGKASELYGGRLSLCFELISHCFYDLKFPGCDHGGRMTMAELVDVFEAFGAQGLASCDSVAQVAQAAYLWVKNSYQFDRFCCHCTVYKSWCHRVGRWGRTVCYLRQWEPHCYQAIVHRYGANGGRISRRNAARVRVLGSFQGCFGIIDVNPHKGRKVNSQCFYNCLVDKDSHIGLWHYSPPKR